MTKRMNHRERMEALLQHEAVDQIPVSFWRHFPIDDQDPEKLAAVTIQFQNTYEFDFIKVSPSSSFCTRDWGVRDEWKGNPEGARNYYGHVVASPEDWSGIKALDHYQGSLGKQLECLKLLKKEYGSGVPIIQTIFSPLSQAKHLVENGTILNHVHDHPEELKAGLEIITRSTANFIAACMEVGIDGFYYAIQLASYDLLNPAELADFQINYDRKLFPLFKDFWLNVAHLHGKNIMAKEIAAADYPLQIFNWHDRETQPDLQNGKVLFKRVLSGGLNRMGPILTGNEREIKITIDDAVRQTQGKDFVLSTGCVLMQATPVNNIHFATNYVRSISV